jgi:lipoate---protein ligase
VVDVVRTVGSVAELHHLDPFEGETPVVPTIWWCHPSDDAIVLGSRQHDGIVDTAACALAGLAVVRRRSGGGAVIMRRSSVHWVDVVLPPGCAPDDVRGSMVWIGERWRRSIQPETTRTLEVHDGGMVCSAWSDLVCFSGIGPGEVLVDGDKLVGLSQRRTRHGIRIQALVYGASVAAEYRHVLAGELPRGDPPGQAWQAELDISAVVARLALEIGRDITPM